MYGRISPDELMTEALRLGAKEGDHVVGTIRTVNGKPKLHVEIFPSVSEPSDTVNP